MAAAIIGRRTSFVRSSGKVARSFETAALYDCNFCRVGEQLLLLADCCMVVRIKYFAGERAGRMFECASPGGVTVKYRH